MVPLLFAEVFVIRHDSFKIALAFQDSVSVKVLIMSSKNEYTSKSVASKAAKILSNPKSTPAQKSVAGSALTQARPKKK
jgi:hypothetical protein